MYDEIEARQLCIRAIKQYTTAAQDISAQDKADGKKALGLLEKGGDPVKTSAPVLCSALASYLKSLKAIEEFVISDQLFLGFDGANPLLVALDREISLTLETKGQICHEDVPRRQSRVDW